MPKRFHYECEVNFKGESKSRVKFLFDGAELEGPDMYPIGVTIVDSSNPTAILHDYQLRYRLGKNVRR